MYQSSKPSGIFTTIGFVNHGPIDPYFDNNHMRLHFKRQCKHTTVESNGYNINGIGLHILRLRTDNSKGDNAKQFHDYAKDVISGEQALPTEISKYLDMSQSVIANHPNDLFNKFSQSKQHDIKEVYGTPNMYDSFINSCGSQKRFQDQIEAARYAPNVTYFLRFGDDLSELNQKTLAYVNKFDRIKLAKVKASETYTGIDEDGNSQTILVVDFDTSDIRKENGKRTLDGFVSRKADELNLQWLEDWTIDNLHQHWQSCNQITCHQGGSFYDDFKVENDTSHINYTNETEDLNSLAEQIKIEPQAEQDNLSERSTTPKKKQDNRHYFAFELGKVYEELSFININLAIEVAYPDTEVKAYFKDSTNTQYLTVKFDQDSEGVNRKWFTQSDMCGSKLLQSENIIVKQLSILDEAKFFISESPDRTIYGDKQSLVEFTEAQQEITNTKDIASVKLCDMFRLGLISGKYDTIIDLRNEFKHNTRVLMTISKNIVTLKHMVTQFKQSNYEELPTKDPKESLREFTELNPLKPDEAPLSNEDLYKFDLHGILQATLNIVIINRVSKRGAIILHGVPNSGKSTIMRKLNKIFICDYRQHNLGNFANMPKPRSHKFQIVFDEEADIPKYLDSRHLASTKLFLERKGIHLEPKGYQAALYYQDAAVMLASNDFDLSKLKQNSKDAIKQRSEIVELHTSYDGGRQFPISSRQIAQWLLTKYNEHCDSEKQLTSNVILGKRTRSTEGQVEMQQAVKRCKIDNELRSQPTLF